MVMDEMEICVCEICGGECSTVDATAEWNKETQEHEIVDIHGDRMWCNNCEEEVRTGWRKLDRQAALDIKLWRAVRERNALKALVFIENGADVNAGNNAGYTPLHVACEYSYPVAARLLIERGADVNARDNNGRTPLDIVVELRPNHPLREELLELFRELAPEAVFEKFCTASPAGP